MEGARLARREFYADVRAANPASARADLTDALADMAYDPPEAGFEAWKWGCAGFSIVDPDGGPTCAGGSITPSSGAIIGAIS